MKTLLIIIFALGFFSHFANAKEYFGKKEKNPEILSDEYWLFELFKEQPYSKNTIPRKKIALINAIAKYNSERSVKILTEILERYLKTGPVTKKHVYADNDYSCVMRTALLGISSNEKAEKTKKTQTLIRKLVSTDTSNLKKQYDWKISWREQELAYMVKLSMEMQRENKKTNWLLSQLTGLSAGKKEHWVAPSVKSIEAIKNGAIIHLLLQKGNQIESVISNEFKTSNEEKKLALRYILKRIKTKK